jgi:hypothetical protein
VIRIASQQQQALEGGEGCGDDAWVLGGGRSVVVSTSAKESWVVASGMHLQPYRILLLHSWDDTDTRILRRVRPPKTYE